VHWEQSPAPRAPPWHLALQCGPAALAPLPPRPQPSSARRRGGGSARGSTGRAAALGNEVQPPAAGPCPGPPCCVVAYPRGAARPQRPPLTSAAGLPSFSGGGRGLTAGEPVLGTFCVASTPAGQTPSLGS